MSNNAKKQRVSYTLASANEPATTHSSGVNGLALDFVSPSAVLYSGGRDARVHAWDVKMDFASLRENIDANSIHNLTFDSDSQDDLIKTTLKSNSSSNYKKFSVLSDHISIPPRAANQSQSDNQLNQQENIAPPQSLPLKQSSLLHQQIINSSSTARSVSFRDQLVASPIVTEYSNDNLRNRTFSGQSGASFASGGSAFGSTNWARKIHPTVHMRSFQAHSDWVNDVILCNRNQSIVTCSNDRMVYLWSTTQTNMYMRLGYHSDHVKCLAYSSIGGWVASGGLDRRVMIWDTMEGRDREIVGFSVSSSVFCHDKSPQSSIYALATNPSGTTLVSGSPDKTIRVWDPRSGKQAIGLRGHRDNIRGLLVSDDGKWVVSASSDTTIKLWSLAHPQRCMVTYTQFEESVWCLYSNHPDLDTFWAGGKEGLVTKMSRRRVGGGDVGERSGTGGVNGGGTGERKKGGRLEDELVDCVAICREDGPVHKIVAVDDMFVWTATNKSSINRWRDIPFRQAIVVPNRNTIPEEPGDRIYIPADSIIQQQRAVLGGGRGNPFRKDSTLSHHHQTVNTTNGRQEIAGSYTMDDSLSRSASILSKDGFSLSNAANLSFSIAGGVLNSSFNDLDNEGDDEEEEAKVIPVWNTPDYTIEGSAGIVKYMLMNNRMHVVTEDSSGLVCLWDIVLCVKLKDFERPAKLEDGVDFFKKCCDEVNTFEWIANWCTIDTKNGVLTVHLDESKFYEAEVYYESVGQVPPMEDQRVNIGRWVLSYLFISYMHVFRQQIPPAAVMYHDHYFGALTYTQLAAPPDSTSHYLFGQTVYYGPPDLVFTNSSAEVLLQMQIQQQQGNQFPGSPLNPSYMNAAAKESSANTSPGLERKPRFDSLPRDGSTPGISIAAAETESVASGKGSESGEQTGTETPTMPPGPEKPVRLRPRPLIPATRPESVMMVESALSHVQQIIKKPVPYAPNPDELPVIRIPPDVSLLVSCEESPEAACYLDQFRSTVGQIGWVREAMRLHECIPRWVIEAINDKKLKEAPKMSFVMQPHPFSDLPELPNGANRLSSNRMIRLRKLLAYVADQAKITPPLNLVKAALMAQRLQQQHEGPPLDDRKPVPWTGVVNPGSVESLSVGPPPPVSSDTASTKSGVGNIFRRKRSATSGAVSVNSETAIDSALLKDVNVKELVKPEEYLELVCQDKALDPKMTLGTVKNLIWKSGAGDMVLTYRRKNL